MSAANIVEFITAAANKEDYGNLTAAAVFAGLDKTLEGENLLLVAPEKSKFDGLADPSVYRWNKEYTKNLLLNHVTTNTGNGLEDGTYTTLFDSNNFTVSSDSITKISGSDSSINIFNVNGPSTNDASKYRIYNISDFVIPSTQQSPEQTLAVAGASSIAPVVQYVTSAVTGALGSFAAGGEFFDEKNAYTVFLPTDSAFTDLTAVVGSKPGFQDYVSTSGEKGVDDALFAHVYIGGAAVTSGEFSSVNTKTADKITVDVTAKTVTISGQTANIIDMTPVITKNGQAHKIDRVLHFPRNTTVEIAKDAAPFLYTLVGETKLVSDLNNLNKSTVFAPTDDALNPIRCFGKWSGDLTPDNVKNVLLHHVLGSRLYSKDVSNDPLSSLNERINKTELVNSLVRTDVLATNGNIHIINKTLIPPALAGSLPGTIVDEAQKRSLAEVVKFLGLTDLVDTLNKCKYNELTDELTPYTVFAPSDEAFDGLSTDDVTYLTSNDNEKLKEVLKYHVVIGAALSADLEETQELETLNVNLLVEKKSDVVFVGTGGAKVTAKDLKGLNGVVHVIDKILLPVGVDLPSQKANGACIESVSWLSTLALGAASYLFGAV